MSVLGRIRSARWRTALLFGAGFVVGSTAAGIARSALRET